MTGAQAVEDATLAVEDVALSFAGVTALDGVSFRVEPRTVHAVIGPNGAGKTSTFNVICGVYAPDRGSVTLGGNRLTGLAPHRIARLGIGRAFQNIALSGRQTVLENILLGRHVLTRAGVIASGLRLPSARREAREGRAKAAEIAELVGMAPLLDRPAGLLSYGDKKRLELARALAMEPSVLLLDEPVAGMNDEETARTAGVIRDVRDRTGVSVLLIEHDMSLVMDVSDRVTVLDFGRLVADGAPDEVRRHPEVLRAYLGGALGEAGEADEADGGADGGEGRNQDQHQEDK
ncbi:ABC transporter ATP-binding protein [Actinomadura verrucosospora]|uniref:Branched-chain amino acid ABC transporter ATP-binding protein n=1 Tax=Actinomadura verrucosospora TaxID=46165 RepID=A0A7D3VUK1_ACTVE|nr:ABC transporter ATP-binding protein [Actinomadura verrucosospora]QKG21374.1 branched-chain amino acid ABC transporter ATP-binding protein [Actinomadura verrucosospora]